MWQTRGGRCIYQASDGTSVYQNLFYRWLTFGTTAIQTLLNRFQPEKPGLRYLHQLTIAVKAQPNDCCLLGLGGAGAAHALTPYLEHSNILAVETNAQVIDIASRYFMIDRLRNFSIKHQDAMTFVQEYNTSFPHLLVDLFGTSAFPKTCNNSDFFAHCKRILTPDGILAVNIANHDEHWRLFNFIRMHFPQSTVTLPVKGSCNIIVLACNNESITPLLNLFKGIAHVKRLSWDPKWGCMALLSP